MEKDNLIYQVHDKFFKMTFADKGVKESFLQTYLPEELLQDMILSTVEEVNPAFIAENFTLEESDLLMKIRTKNGEDIYLLALIEHKSYKDRKTPVQILRYLLNIWESQLSKKETLSLILPIVIYEGKHQWNYPQLKDYFKDIPEKWRKYLPLYETLFFDFSLEKNLSKLPENISLRSYLQIIQTVYAEDQRTFFKQLIEVLQFVDKERGEDIETFIKIFKRIITYTENTRKDLRESKKNLIDLLKGAYDMILRNSIQEWEDAIKLEGRLEGKLEGKLEGRFEGEQAEKIKIANNLKNLGISDEVIQQATGLMI